MPNLLDRLIHQLDALVPYLSLAHEEVFELVKSEYDTWCRTPKKTPLPDTFDVFATQIAHAAFILGFSYIDAFLADLLREIFRKHPDMSPREKKLSFDIIVHARNYNTVISRMIEQVVRGLMHDGLDQIAKYFKEKLSIRWPPDETQKLMKASLIRNCIIHNNSLVDHRLDEYPEWNFGERIVLSDSDVHEYGLAVRSIVRHVYKEAETRHLRRQPKPNS